MSQECKPCKSAKRSLVDMKIDLQRSVGMGMRGKDVTERIETIKKNRQRQSDWLEAHIQANHS